DAAARLRARRAVRRQRREDGAGQSERRAEHVDREPLQAARRVEHLRCRRGDGVIKLSVNGLFVNGISRSSQKKGYLCLESEGAEIHFRNIKLMELPPGVTSAEQTAPVLK